MIHHMLSQLSIFSAVAVLLLLPDSCRGQSAVIGPLQPIVASVGDNVTLPCHLEPAVDAAAITFEWTRADLSPKFVHVWHSGENLMDLQNPAYKDRTSVSEEKLKSGDISLKLSNIKPSDEGKYRCFIPGWKKESFVELVVDAASTFFIVGIDRGSDGVVLDCESRGWYPEPEVFWLDGEGNLLSAGPTETVRGPDDLYTVSSRVTVEKRHSNSFTCRVQQNHTNQIREAQIYIADDFFDIQPSSFSTTVCLAAFLAVSIPFNLILGFFVWKYKTKRSHRDETIERENENHSQSNRSEDRVVTGEERETQLLMTPKNNCIPVQLEVLNEEEQLRREANEKARETLEAELETKKTELRKKRSYLQQLDEEKQKKEENMKKLKEHLENKKTEVKELEAALAQYWKISSSSEKKEHQQKKAKAETEVENREKQLETEQMELATKTKQINDKQAEVQQLQEEIQKMETNLQSLTEQLESRNVEGNQM